MCFLLLVRGAIPQDPFFVLKTQEEIEEFGDSSDIGPNLAKMLMNLVRRRNGLHVTAYLAMKV